MPTGTSAWAALGINMAITLVSDYLYVIAVSLGPLFTHLTAFADRNLSFSSSRCSKRLP